MSDKNETNQEIPQGPDSINLGQAQVIAALEKEVDDMRSKVLRAHADYQNAVRRNRLDVAEAREQQVFDIAKSLVNVFDHFDMALNVDPNTVSAQNLLMGLQMVRAEMHKTMEGFGLKRLTANPGDEFNPKLHEAVMRQKAPGVPATHVASQLQSGYGLGEKTIRPVKVAIAE